MSFNEKKKRRSSGRWRDVLLGQDDNCRYVQPLDDDDDDDDDDDERYEHMISTINRDHESANKRNGKSSAVIYPDYYDTTATSIYPIDLCASRDIHDNSIDEDDEDECTDDDYYYNNNDNYERYRQKKKLHQSKQKNYHNDDDDDVEEGSSGWSSCTSGQDSSFSSRSSTLAGLSNHSDHSVGTNYMDPLQKRSRSKASTAESSRSSKQSCGKSNKSSVSSMNVNILSNDLRSDATHQEPIVVDDIYSFDTSTVRSHNLLRSTGSGVIDEGTSNLQMIGRDKLIQIIATKGNTINEVHHLQHDQRIHIISEPITEEDDSSIEYVSDPHRHRHEQSNRSNVLNRITARRPNEKDKKMKSTKVAFTPLLFRLSILVFGLAIVAWIICMIFVFSRNHSDNDENLTATTSSSSNSDWQDNSNNENTTVNNITTALDDLNAHNGLNTSSSGFPVITATTKNVTATPMVWIDENSDFPSHAPDSAIPSQYPTSPNDIQQTSSPSPTLMTSIPSATLSNEMNQTISEENTKCVQHRLRLPFVGKKGLALSINASEQKSFTDEAFRLIQPHWTYVWDLYKLDQPFDSGVEIVPIAVTDYSNLRIDITKNVPPLVKQGKIKRIMGFIEPDHKEEVTRMSVERALELWPTLESLNISLLSPTCDKPNGKWMKSFMKQASKACKRVDYLSIQWTGGADPLAFKDKMRELYDMYQKPLVISKLNPRRNDYQDDPTLANQREVLEFMKDILPWIQTQDWIAGYAWFTSLSAVDAKTMSPSSLMYENGELTKCGEYYASITNENPNGNQDIGIVLPDANSEPAGKAVAVGDISNVYSDPVGKGVVIPDSNSDSDILQIVIPDKPSAELENKTKAKVVLDNSLFQNRRLY